MQVIFSFHEGRSFLHEKLFSVLLLLLMMSSGAFAATKADVVFFIDASGSMQDNINAVRDNIAAFSRSLVEDQVDVRFALVEFKDDIDYRTDYYTYLTILDRAHRVIVHSFNGSDWTSDASAVESALDSIVADGDDETQTDAMNRIFSWSSFRSDASRFGFLLTDEDTEISEGDTSYDNEHFVTLEELIPKFKNISMPLSVISEPLLRDHYLSLFSETGGVFIDITQSDFYRAMLSAANWITEQSNTDVSERLPYATIAAVPEDIYNNDDIMRRIAALASADVGDIHVIKSGAINLSLPREPTEAMKQSVNGEFIAKTDTLKLTPETGKRIRDDGTALFLFMMNVPDEVLDMDLNISDIELYFATEDDFADTASLASAPVKVKLAFDPFSYWEITNLLGYEADTFAKKVLVLVMGNAGQSLSMWVVKILLALLGGCNVGGVVPYIGFAGLLGLGGGFAFKKFFEINKDKK